MSPLKEAQCVSFEGSTMYQGSFAPRGEKSIFFVFDAFRLNYYVLDMAGQRVKRIIDRIVLDA